MDFIGCCDWCILVGAAVGDDVLKEEEGVDAVDDEEIGRRRPGNVDDTDCCLFIFSCC